MKRKLIRRNSDKYSDYFRSEKKFLIRSGQSVSCTQASEIESVDTYELVRASKVSGQEAHQRLVAIRSKYNKRQFKKLIKNRPHLTPNFAPIERLNILNPVIVDL